MCWNNLKFNCRILFESREITGAKLNDRKALISLVASEFPDYPRLRIAYVIDKYMQSMLVPITTNEFIDFLKRYIQ